jgi:SpoVK/Ycf46/Vps4 family AAA+-type ATPase
MHPDLKLHLRSLTRLTYVVTDEEDRVIKEIIRVLPNRTAGKGVEPGKGPPPTNIKVYNGAFGLIPASQLVAEWSTRALGREEGYNNIIKAMETIYTEETRERLHYYIITDPERYFQNEDFVRRVLNIVHQLQAEFKVIKCLIFVGARLVIPPKLASYMHVVRDTHLDEQEVQGILDGLHPKVRKRLPEGATSWFQGLTGYQINSALAQAIIRTKSHPDPEVRGTITRACIHEYKRERIKKTDLLSLVDTSAVSFDVVGGVDRFKSWAVETRHAWTPEGKAFGLKPPKGVLCVGVWGCGKSLSVKALGAAWGLPVIQLELGRLRNSGVGNTEDNTYRVVGYLEAMAPCICWVDEAEKSFSGAQSSSYSDAGTTARALGILSTWHQETTAEVCLALTANSLKTLPVEFTNRISERFFFDLPSEDDRIEILKIQLKKFGNLSPAEISEWNLRTLAETAEGMVPREMEQAVDAALRKSFHQRKPKLDFGIFEQELRSKPRILKTMDAELKEVLDWVGYDETSRDGLRARYASTRQSTNTLQILKGGIE